MSYSQTPKFIGEHWRKWKYPGITNLIAHLQKVSNNTNCLLTLDNFQGANMCLSGNPVPVILREPVPLLLLQDNLENKAYYPLIGGMNIDALRNFSLSGKTTSGERPLSKFLSGFNRQISKRYSDVFLILNPIS